MSVSVVLKNSCSTTGEGPHWDVATQSLLYVDLQRGDVHRWDSTTGEDQKLNIGTATSVIVPSSAGGYIVTVGRTVGHLDWDTNTYTQFAKVDPNTNNRFNDGKCDAEGRLWAGTMGVSISNGLTWSEDNRIMFYIDSIPGNIFAYDYDLGNGTINTASKRVVLSFGDVKTSEHGLPDGMTIDTDGKLWVACYTRGKVIRVDPETGKVIQEVVIPSASRTTSCCFGGKNLDELYVTSARFGVTEEEFQTTQPLAGSVFKVTGLGAKGRPAHIFQA